MTALFRAIRIAKKRLRLIQRVFEKHLTPLHEYQARRLLRARRLPYEAWLGVNQHSPLGSAALRLALSRSGKTAPSISVVMPVYRPPLDVLQEAVASVRAQIFEDWELCIADDSGVESQTRDWLRNIASLDHRIRLTVREKNGGIAAATNSATSIARGDIVVFLDQDDLLHEDCLGEIALYYSAVPIADIVYTDHDKIDAAGNRFEPAFKPAWSPTLLLSHMYLGHTLSVRRELLEDVGGFRSAFDGAQDFDLALRLSEKARHIGHIPRILYHWRVLPGSTAASGDAKPESLQAGQNALTEALARRRIAGEAVQSEWARQRNVGLYQVAFRGDLPKVSVLLPRLEDYSALKAILEAFANTDYPSWDILTDHDLSSARHVLSSLKHAQIDAGIDGAARWQAMAFQTDAPFVVLFSQDAAPVSKDWLKQLAGQAMMADADAVGGQLRRNGRIAENGLVLDGAGDAPQPRLEGSKPSAAGPCFSAQATHESLAPSSHALLVKRERLLALDVSHCDGRSPLAAVAAAVTREKPGLVVPSAIFETRDTIKRLIRTRTALPLDPYVNENLTRNGGGSPRAVCAPLPAGQIVAALFSHNLAHEGAPRTLVDLAIGLKRKGRISPILISPSDGPLGDECRQVGIPVSILAVDNLLSWPAAAADYLKTNAAHVVLANSLQSWRALEAARLAKKPAVAWQHESEAWHSFFKELPDRGAQAYRLLQSAYAVVYVAEATRVAWAEVTQDNSIFIPTSLPDSAPIRHVPTKEAARHHLGQNPKAFQFLLPGTVCERKGQIDAVKAFSALPTNIAVSSRLFIVGAQPEDAYLRAITAALARAPEPHRSSIVLTGPVHDMTPWFAASDVVICTSRIESAPRIILEAMAVGRPIVTTPVYGIQEMLYDPGSAFFYQPGDDADLARLMDRLYSCAGAREDLSTRAKRAVHRRISEDEMLKEWEIVLLSAAKSTPTD